MRLQSCGLLCVCKGYRAVDGKGTWSAIPGNWIVATLGICTWQGASWVRRGFGGVAWESTLESRWCVGVHGSKVLEVFFCEERWLSFCSFSGSRTSYWSTDWNTVSRCISSVFQGTIFCWGYVRWTVVNACRYCESNVSRLLCTLFSRGFQPPARKAPPPCGFGHSMTYLEQAKLNGTMSALS